ncbi:Myotubularin-like phosphatase domain-domain-containing protein [Naematelia encephala]|uniref:Myotubularin-like phosphatase domain-domain-containing protein n=1 Tax=Naematelia encephala TaxID=71784 RepID=A0A1Y2AM13_9TREE|nr:Myotubularin-like phosphatase domain-domain-containing protein [Naematelia encephala]
MDSLRVAKVESVLLEYFLPPVSSDSVPTRTRRTGTLHLTSHHLIFSPEDASSSSAPSSEIWIPYPSITLLTRLPLSLHGLYPLQVRTRTFDNYVLLFERDRSAEDVWQSVRNCAVASSVEQLYAFYYSLPANSRSSETSGWNTYKPRAEFARQGLGTRTKAWRFTDINKEYTFCPTYPSKLAVPSRISDSLLAHAGKYRSKARIPALTYLHWANHASITRSSQPMVGLKNSRSAQDERLVDCIFSSHTAVETAFSPMQIYGATATNLIIDARPTTNAMANVAMGAGTENMENYKAGKKAYLGIDNIHVMRNSLKVIGEAIADAENTGTLDRALLRKSQWLRHISTLLDGAMLIVRNIHLNASHVLIHCSDGWDRTSQLSAIAQVCLDPYYRTFEGFAVLIEKDWLAFGHKFLDRSGHLSSEKLFTITDNPDDESDEEFSGSKAAKGFFASVQKQFASNSHVKEVSPVFHQFLDCVWQIQRQFPNRFEFTEDLLLDLHRHLYACQFGTFLFNNERERREPVQGKPFIERTVSAWDVLRLDRYRNETYEPTLDDRDARDTDQGVLMANAKDVRFWYRLFRRGDDEMNGQRQFVPGAEMLGPIGSDQVDPVLLSAVPDQKPSTDDVRTSQSHGGPAWKWSQFSSGAINALQKTARDLQTIGVDAVSQLRAEVKEVNGERGDDVNDFTRKPLSQSTVLPIESDPWTRDDTISPKLLPKNPWVESHSGPSLSDLTLVTKPVKAEIEKTEVDKAEIDAALGGDRQVWDPLGAL